MSTAAPLTAWEYAVNVPAVHNYVRHFKPKMHSGLQSQIFDLLSRQEYLEEATPTWNHSWLEKPKPSHNPADVYVFKKGDIIDVAYGREKLPEDTFIEGEQLRVPGKRLAVTFERLGVSAPLMNTFLHVFDNTNELLTNQDLLYNAITTGDEPRDERVRHLLENPDANLSKIQADVLLLDDDLAEMGVHFEGMLQLVDKLNRLHGPKATSASASAHKEANVLTAIEAV